MAWRVAKHRKLDAVLDQCNRAAQRAQRRALRNGIDPHNAGIAANQAYHRRRAKLLTKRGIDGNELSARADELDRAERTPEELQELERIEKWLDERDAEREQQFAEEETEAEREQERLVADRLRAIEAERARMNVAAASDNHDRKEHGDDVQLAT